MSKFSVNYMELESKLSQKKAFRLSDVKHRIKKVAFDVVRFVDSDKIDDLWQIHRDGDDEYIVAMYEDNQKEQSKVASNSPWKVLPDGAGKFINFFLNDNPIKKIAMSDLGIPTEDVYLVCSGLANKLSTDKTFLNSFVKELTVEERKAFEEIDLSRG